MKHTPSSRLPSAQKIVEDAGRIKVSKSQGWERQRRVPAQIAYNIELERRARAAKGIIG